MHIKGDVVKIETITQSTIPLTEMYANAFNPKYALSLYAGNIVIEFNRHGNVKKSTGYGIDGKKIFNVTYNPTAEASFLPSILIGPVASQKVNKTTAVSSKDGAVVNARYYDDRDNLIWNQKAKYNADGSVDLITKEYAQLSIKNNLFNITYADTTEFNYLSYDHMGNWTEAEVSYTGVLPRHSHAYRIKRTLTYLGESNKAPLIDDLKDYNPVETATMSKTIKVPLASYGNMSIPSYMKLQSSDFLESTNSQISYIFISTYNNDDSYASISANLQPSNGSDSFDSVPVYNVQYDRKLRKQFSAALEQGNVYILKWLPYRLVTISGKRSLCISYYRYGAGSPIPIYCESYTIPLEDGYTLYITTSFQSNDYNRFLQDFRQSIESIDL